MSTEILQDGGYQDGGYQDGGYQDGGYQDGGRIFNKQGAYGCIYTGQLLCKNNTKVHLSPTDKFHMPLTKITLVEDGEMEITISNRIQKIPNWRNYFSISEAICEPSPRQTDPDINKCDVIKTVNTNKLRILSMKYNGIALSSYNFNLKMLDLMRFVSHIIEAGALLALRGIIHRDLHHGNMLVDSLIVPRIIDFNLSIMSSTASSDIGNIMRHKYEYQISQEPPDSMILNAVLQGYDTDKVINDLLYKKNIIHIVSALLSIPLDTVSKELKQFVYGSQYIKQKNIVNWFRTFWHLIDSWAIGVIIASKLFEFKHMSIYSRFKQHEHVLFPILRMMCAIDPRKRIDCVEALYILQPNHIIIRKFGGKEWLNKMTK
jgi:serine/threonine protein kinase